MTYRQSNPLRVDTLVVGAGLAGLLSASIRARSGKQTLVAETSTTIGGRWSPELRNGFHFGAGLGHSNLPLWRTLYESVGLPFESISLENGRAIVSSPKGWQEAEGLPLWEGYFARDLEGFPKGGFVGLVQGIEASGGFKILRESPVTELEVEGGRAVRARLGADLVVEFEECLWAAGAKSLMESLRGDQVPEMGPARVAWMRNFVLHGATPGVVLEFAHGSLLSEFTETLFLPLPQPEGEEERRYLVGAFLSNRDKSLAPEGKQVSSWIFEVGEESAEDNHEMMKRIRSARRAIEKCFPGFEKSVLFDRVQVLPHTITPIKKPKKKIEPIFANLVPVADWTAPSGAHFEGLSENILSLLQGQ